MTRPARQPVDSPGGGSETRPGSANVKHLLLILSTTAASAGCVVVSAVDTVGSVAVHAAGAAADLTIDAASVAGKAVTGTASLAVDAVKAKP